MNVLFVGARVAPDNMEYHVTTTLRHMGHRVFEFDVRSVISGHSRVGDYARYVLQTVLREPERISERKLVRVASRVNPDLVLVLLGNQVSPKTIAMLRKTVRCPIVCWCQDTMNTLGRQHLLGADYDRVFLKDHYMVRLFGDMLGNRFAYLPEACNPSVHFREVSPDAPETYACDITTAASLYYYRQGILAQLPTRYRLKVWGAKPDWLDYRLGGAHMGRAVWGAEKRYAFSGAKIVLNTFTFGEIESVNCRTFEVAGCGAFQLATHNSTVAELFRTGSEIETFRNADELLEKTAHYLEHPEERAAIADRAMARAHAEHTYEHRLTQLLREAGRESSSS